MKKYFLEIIVFISGSAVMVFELVGARVLSPYVGSSIIVWSILIGVILLFLSLGYWWGGKFADKKPDYKNFSLVIFAAALLIGLTAFLKMPVLNFLQKSIKDIRWEAILASLVLFGPASFLLAAVSPYAARIRIANLTHSGETVGKLYAISTAGSIFGTFLTGFVLISYLGNTKIILLLSLLMLFCSVLANLKSWLKRKIGVALFLFFFLICANYFDSLFLARGLIYVNSQYSDFMISRGVDQFSGRPILTLSTDPKATQSAMFLDKDNDLVFPYLRFFRLAKHFNPNLNKSLMIGGGAYSFPRDFLEKNSQATLDVVEIDPKMTAVAKTYFNLVQNPRLAIFHEDGRVFLNKKSNKYDAIFIDAYKTYLAPFQLTTQEAVGEVYGALNDNGVAMVNIISSINGDTGKFLRAEYATYKKYFPQVYVLRVDFLMDYLTQNLILVALKTDKPPSFSDQDQELDNYLSRVWNGEIKNDVPALSDDYAPVDQYIMEAFEEI